MTDHVDAKATETPRSPHRDALINEMFSPPDSLLQVLRRRLTAGELVAARDRRVGAGMIGARAAGLVFADALLARATSSFTFAVERDDSIFIGSDVSIAFRATGDVPEDIARRLETVSDRWSETPLIVRPKKAGQPSVSSVRIAVSGAPSPAMTGTSSGFSVPSPAAARSRAMPRTPMQSCRLGVIEISITGSPAPE